VPTTLAVRTCAGEFVATGANGSADGEAEGVALVILIPVQKRFFIWLLGGPHAQYRNFMATETLSVAINAKKTGLAKNHATG
jgi:hypothetical protein